MATSLENLKPITTKVIKRSILIAGHKTSISLEEPFWQELQDIAQNMGLTRAALVQHIDAARAGANLSSAIRVFVLQTLRKQAIQ